MYVLADIEWITDQDHSTHPTQLAALRVDDNWQGSELFFCRICPPGSASRDWSHVAYSGGTAEDFLSAKSQQQASEAFAQWLRPDDKICLWHDEPADVFQLAIGNLTGHPACSSVIVLADYVARYLAERQIRCCNTPAHILKACGTAAAEPLHKSDCDAANMAKALQCLSFCAQDLSSPPPDTKWPKAMYYFTTPKTHLVHRRGCLLIPPNAIRVSHPSMKFFFRKENTFCSCMQQELAQMHRKRNAYILANTRSPFVRSSNSQVFHRRSCKLILGTSGTIQCLSHYHRCIKEGYHPCKVCNPTPEPQQNKPKLRRYSSAGVRMLSADEQRSIDRYLQARRERLSRDENSFGSAVEKEDFYTLTQPRFGFFAGTGYETFHLRGCQKLVPLSHIKGFATYEDAICSGRRPCKYCHPTAKNNILCSVPITSHPRPEDSVHRVITLCQQEGYDFKTTAAHISITTPAGKWILDITASPYTMQHLNLVKPHIGPAQYHQQPRLFLSMIDAFYYIRRHDSNLLHPQR